MYLIANSIREKAKINNKGKFESMSYLVILLCSYYCTYLRGRGRSTLRTPKGADLEDILVFFGSFDLRFGNLHSPATIQRAFSMLKLHTIF